MNRCTGKRPTSTRGSEEHEDASLAHPGSWGWRRCCHPSCSPPRRRRRIRSRGTRRFKFSVPEPLRLSWIESLMDRFTQSQADGDVQGEVRPPGPGTSAAHHRRGRRQPAGLLPDGGQVAGRGRPGPDAWKGRVGLGATSEVAQQVASASLPTPSQGGDREDRSGAGHPTRRLRGLPPSKT